MSCRSTTVATTSNIEKEQLSNDSTIINIEKTIHPIIVPQSIVEINVTQEALNSLPTDGAFQNKSGNATVSAKKQKDGTITITANCDSLILLVENLKKEVYHFQSENTALKSEINEQKTQIINEPNGWQWFQIWLSRIAVFFLFLFGIYKLIKKHLKPI
jgi:chaperonin cofactor prefoldin